MTAKAERLLGVDREVVRSAHLSTARTESPASDQIAPYRFWMTYAPFRKDGTPVMGTFGKTAKPVVIFDAEEFGRLCREVPALAAVQFLTGEF